MSIDPLAEDYVYNGPYNFSEDRVIDSRELEGLERKSVTKQEDVEKGFVQFLMTYTPVDMVTVAVTTVTREYLNLNPELGSSAIHLDGTPVTGGLFDIHPGGIPLGKPETNVEVAPASSPASSTLTKAEARAAKLSEKPREGKDFTPAGKSAVIDLNKAKNKGKTVCESCKIETIPATKSQKGVTPSTKETQVDHIKRKRDNGSGTPDNGQVLCRGCNLEKH